MNGIKRWMIVLVSAILLLLILSGILLNALGLFEFTGENASSKIIAATIAVVGGLFTSVVTIVGMFLRHSLDQRNTELRIQEEERLQIESRRNIDLRNEAEQRLKLETAIRAVNLLSTNSGVEAPPSQQAGVLFTLANLGQAALAINIARQLTIEKKIDVKTIEWLIDRALISDDEATQGDACNLLAYVASDLFIVGKEKLSAYFPHCLWEWNPSVTSMTRRLGIQTLLNQMLSRPYSNWGRGYIEKVLVCLTTIWKNDADEPLKNSVGICLEKLLDVFQVPEGTDYWTRDGNWVGIHDVEKEVDGLNAKVETFTRIHAFVTIAEQIEDWETT